MKKLLLLFLFCAFIYTAGVAATLNHPRPPHKGSSSFKLFKSKRVIYGHDRARKKITYRRQGVDYYKYANSTSYLRMMGKAINGG